MPLPTLPTTGLTGHWDASTNADVFTTNNPGGAPSGNCSDGDDANVWRSKVNTAHLMRAITGHGTIPVWKNDAVMAHPSIWFDKTGIDSNGGHRCQDSLGNFTSPADFIAAGLDEYTILIAYHPLRHSGSSFRTMLSTTWTSYSAMTTYVSPGVYGGLAIGYEAGFDTAGPTADTYGLNSSHIIRVRKTATHLYVSVDGGAESSVAHGSPVGDLTYGGSGYYGLYTGWNSSASASTAFSGRIGEVAIWNVALSGSALTDATDYFIEKWVYPNTDPVANAGPDDDTGGTLSYTLAGSASDADLHSMTYLWSKVSGPGTVTFTDATSLTSGVTFSLPGDYVLELTVTDSEGGVGTDTVSLAVNGFTYLWTKESGPGTVVFSDATVKCPLTAAFSATGTYVLRLTVFDGTQTEYDEMTVTVLPATNEDPAPCPSGPWGISIDGVDLTHRLRLADVDIEYTLGSPATLRCAILDSGDPETAVRPEIEQVVIVTKGPTVFTGKIVSSDEDAYENHIGTVTRIEAVDYARVFARRRFTKSYGLYDYILTTEPTTAKVTIRSAGANNDLIFETREGWSGANNYSIEIVDPGLPSQPLTVVAPTSTSRIIYLATDGAGVITTTAADITAIPEFASPGLFWAYLTDDDPTGNDGSGLMDAAAQTNFSGGTDRTFEPIVDRTTNYVTPSGAITVVGTVYEHNLVTGDRIKIDALSGISPDINGIEYIVTVTNAFEFTIPVATTGSGTTAYVYKLVSMNEIIADLAVLFNDYNIILAPLPVDAWLMPKTFVRATLEEILDDITKEAGFIYRLGPLRVLQVFSPGTILAPFTLDGDNSLGSVPQRRTRENYANRLFVTGGVAGEVVARRATWVATGSDTEYVLPDPDSWQQINNMAHPGTQFINGIIAGPITDLFPGTLEWQFDTAGKVLHHTGTPLVAGTIMEFRYDGPSNFVIQLDDLAAQAAMGGEIYDDVYDAGEYATEITARAKGLAELAKRSATERFADIKTQVCLALPGTAIACDIPERLMTGEWMVVSVRMYDSEAIEPGSPTAYMVFYEYELIESGLPTTWIDFWKKNG